MTQQPLAVTQLPDGGRALLELLRPFAAGEHGSEEQTRPFERLGLPYGCELVRGMVAAMALGACRHIVFHRPDAPVLLADEDRLFACLDALQTHPKRSACGFLSDMMVPETLGAVMPFLTRTARMLATRSLRILPPPQAQRPPLRCVH